MPKTSTKKVKNTAQKTTHKNPSAKKPAAAVRRRAKPARESSAGAKPAAEIAPEYRSLYEALLRVREGISGQIGSLVADNLLRTPQEGDVDFRSEEQGTDNYDRDFALTRVSSGQDMLFEIDEALNRLRMGTYGICEGCSCRIEKKRLAAMPYTRLCLKCQSQAEQTRGRRAMAELTPLHVSSEKNNSNETGAEDE